MDYATTKNKVKGEIPYIQHNGKKYRYVDYNTDTDIHYYRYKPLKQPDKKALAKLPTLEEARNLYNIELEETAPTPAEYFMRKIDESSNYNILRTITDNILISYLKQHKDECPEVICKLKELVSTHCIKEVREASLETLIAVGEPDTDSLTHYITDYIPKDSDCTTQRENKTTQCFLDKLSDQSDCILLTLRGTNLIQYLSIYKNHCPDLVDRIKELLKTNRRKKIRVAAYDVLERLQIEQIEDFKKYIQKPNIVEQTGIKPNRTNPLNKEKAIVLYMMLAKKYKDCRSKIKCGVFMNMWKEKFECDKYNISKDSRQKLREMQIAAFAFVKDELDSKTYDEIKEFRDAFQIYSSREIPVELKRLAQSKDVVVELAKDTEKHLSGFNVLVKEKKGVPFAINPLPFGLSEKGVLKLLNSLPTRSEIKEKEKNLTNTLLSESTKVAHKKSAVNAYKAPYATHEFKKFMSNFTIKNCTNKELTLFCVNLCQRVGINNMSNDLPIKYEFCVGSGKRDRSMKRAKARKKGNAKAAKKNKGA